MVIADSSGDVAVVTGGRLVGHRVDHAYDAETEGVLRAVTLED